MILVTITRKTIFIEAEDQLSFEEALNKNTRGLVDATVQIYGLFKCAILYTEIGYEDDEKTIADLFEEAGCGATCGECPYYKKPTDKRVKYIHCKGRKIGEDSRACDDYYLERRENAKAG